MLFFFLICRVYLGLSARKPVLWIYNQVRLKPVCSELQRLNCKLSCGKISNHSVSNKGADQTVDMQAGLCLQQGSGFLILRPICNHVDWRNCNMSVRFWRYNYLSITGFYVWEIISSKVVDRCTHLALDKWTKPWMCKVLLSTFFLFVSENIVIVLIGSASMRWFKWVPPTSSVFVVK